MIDPLTTARWLQDWVERGTWRDLPRVIVPTDSAPVPSKIPVNPEKFLRPGGLTPLDRLRMEAEKIGVAVLDLRGMDRTIHYPFPKWGYFRDKVEGKNIPKRGRARGRLPWEKRTAIMLHKTDVEEMGPRRFLGTPCHDAIANDATIVLCHPHDAYVMHGHNANRFAIGVEFADRDGELDGLQVAASHILLRYIHEDRQAHVEGRMVIMPHAFSHWSRTRDPDGRIWRQVAVPMASDLDLVLGPVVGTGTRPKWATLPGVS